MLPVDQACQDPDVAVVTQQPWLHELEVLVRAPVTCLALPDGDIDARRRGGEGTGLFVDDRRILHTLTLLVSGVPPVGIARRSVGATGETLLVARDLGDGGHDPTVEVARRRQLVDGGMVEQVVIRNRSLMPVAAVLAVHLSGDGAEMHDVKSGNAEPRSPATFPDLRDVGVIRWSDDRHEVRVEAPGARTGTDGDGASASWHVEVAGGGEVAVELRVAATRHADTEFDAEPGADAVDFSQVRVSAQDRRLDRTVDTSVDDLRNLILRDPSAHDDVFAAAGTPWYLTLFGRDSLWAARMMLPFGTDLARGTLRALARRQGTVDDPATAEAPGKILHEVRRVAWDQYGNVHLPPLYYGSVDATPLWACVLHDAWRWGMDEHTVSGLLPPLRAALGWMRRAADESPDGLLRYVDESGSGLTNQGWKDSGDSMRDAHGVVADGPIALVETQAYAVEAALGAADLLEAVGGEDGTVWRSWASEIADRVRQRFWVADGSRHVLAMALDGAGRPVDGIGSNMGHTLGTGLLDERETALVAEAIARPDLLGPFGVSTLSRENPAYNPIGYHTGSVWTHDTAICAHGLARAGHPEVAAGCLRALVDVAASSSYRWPELYGAEPVLGAPAPYPASCRPQAWAAASVGAVVSVLLGIRADAPRGVVHLDPLPSAPFGALRVDGLRVGEARLAVTVDSAGQVVDVEAPGGLEVVVGSR
ncbi:MAG: glycogen debranching N-terminal domain-containing protein [Dermatophilaceae bacterium]